MAFYSWLCVILVIDNHLLVSESKNVKIDSLQIKKIVLNILMIL